MSKIRCIIVEDEMPAILELKYILENYDFVDIISEFNDGKTALDWITNNDVEVVFLDINMPNINGLELAKEISKNDNIHLVFITAHEDFALNAFELGAVDYILKPYNEKRIEKTLLRLKEHILIDSNKSNKEVKEKIEKIFEKLCYPNNFKKIACEYKGKTLLLDLDDIYYCYIENEETMVKTKDMTYFTNYNLNELEEKTGFFRIHRSYLVNLSKVKEIYPWFNGTYKITMNDVQKSELQVSRSRVKELKEALEI